jgi:hypothetical protein
MIEREREREQFLDNQRVCADLTEKRRVMVKIGGYPEALSRGSDGYMAEGSFLFL